MRRWARVVAQQTVNVQYGAGKGTRLSVWNMTTCTCVCAYVETKTLIWRYYCMRIVGTKSCIAILTFACGRSVEELLTKTRYSRKYYRDCFCSKTWGSLRTRSFFVGLFSFFRFPKIGNRHSKLKIRERRGNSVQHVALVCLVCVVLLGHNRELV